MTHKLRGFAAVLLAVAAASPALAFEPIVSLPSDSRVIHPDGATDEILATREQTGGQVSVLILGGDGGGPGPAIIHSREAELWYVLEGDFEFHVGDRVINGGPGTFVAVDAGQPHGFIQKGKGRLLVIFTPGGYEHFFMDWAEKGLTAGPGLAPLEESYGVTRP